MSQVLGSGCRSGRSGAVDRQGGCRCFVAPDVLYHAGPGERQGRAWEIIRGLVRPEQQARRVLAESMGTASAAADWRLPYRSGVEQIAADCRRGLEVAFVTEGDPSLFSTAAYVWQLLAELFPDVAITIVPGISSISAAAARALWPLAQKDETLRIIPAAHHAARLASWAGADSQVCLLKVAGVLPQLRDLVAAQGPGCQAVYVENLGTEREWITHDLAQAVGRDQYFSLVLLRRNNLPSTTGKVWVVGLGPGDPELLTGQALRILHAASDVVGYSAYLKLLEPAPASAPRFPSVAASGAETERAVPGSGAGAGRPAGGPGVFRRRRRVRHGEPSLGNRG